MKRSTGTIVTALLLASAVAWAQQPPPGSMGPGMNSGMGPRNAPGGQPQGEFMGENFFPPELVMQNQKAIGLKEDQQATIRKEMKETMANFTDLQWQQSAESETMASLVKQERPDEKQVLAQFDKLMKIENDIKRMHIAMLVKVKNVLTPEQQAQLRELKRSMMQQGRMQQRPGNPPARAGGPQGPDQPPPPEPPQAAPGQ